MRDPIKELRQLVDAATPNLDHDETAWDATGARVVYHDDEDSDYDVVGLFTKPQDGKAYVALRNAAPALLDIAEAARGVAESIEERDSDILAQSYARRLRDALERLEKEAQR